MEKQQNQATSPVSEALPRKTGTPSDFEPDAIQQISAVMNELLADTFALYLKTKNFHWHMSGPNFREYHKLLDDQSEQIFAMTDPIAERVRKIGGRTIKSTGEIARKQRLTDNDSDFVEPLEMLAELHEDNKFMAARLREVHDVCDARKDYATASLIETWIDESERRAWFLYEATRPTQSSVH